MNVKEIKELADLVARRGLASLELEEGGFRLRIEGPRPVPREPGPAAPAYPAAPVSWEEKTPRADAPAVTGGAPPPADLDTGLHVVTSPIVGTFYRAPNPDSEPFAKVGDSVEKGATLCIVEAMKLMNEIEADVAGRSSRSSRRTGSPSSSARSSSRSGRPDVPQGPRREPRGDRPADHRGLQGARDRDRGRPLDGRPGRPPRPRRRRIGLHRPGVARGLLPQHHLARRRRRDHRRRRGPPGLRLPRRERPLRRDPRRGRADLDRSVAGCDPQDGRQVGRQGHREEGGRPDGARKPRSGRLRRGGAERRGPDRVPGPPQGRGRWRRPRDASRPQRQGARGGLRPRHGRSGARLLERRALPREVPCGAPPRRGPGLRRPPRQDRPSRRAGVLPAEAAPEGARGVALSGCLAPT